MDSPEISDPLFRQAVSAIDAGDVGALERLLREHPELVRDRVEYGEEEYFRQPYLLWFVAENPVRHGKLPENIVEVTRTVLQAAQRQNVESFRRQVDYALGLVCSGRVPREQGAQLPLIDLLCGEGADPSGALRTALAHRELAAAQRLLDRGAKRTLLFAACIGETAEIERLWQEADAGERQDALAGAALYGNAPALAVLLGLGADAGAYNPPGLHANATALHQAVGSKSLAAVQVLVEAGADLGAKDRDYQATPLGWAEYFEYPEIAAYLRARGAP